MSCTTHIISSQTSVNYLGLNIDQYLSDEVIVNSIIKKVNSRLKLLCRLSIALVPCYFDYSCSSGYEGVCKSLTHKLQVMQNETVRFVKKLGLELELITRYVQMLEFLILKTKSNNLSRSQFLL